MAACAPRACLQQHGPHTCQCQQTQPLSPPLTLLHLLRQSTTCQAAGKWLREHSERLQRECGSRQHRKHRNRSPACIPSVQATAAAQVLPAGVCAAAGPLHTRAANPQHYGRTGRQRERGRLPSGGWQDGQVQRQGPSASVQVGAGCVLGCVALEVGCLSVWRWPEARGVQQLHRATLHQC